ncbi:MAG: KilA-N domain-containing protein [Bacteroidales bacterium]|nr:KilA-N domain-containing protein [Bacteroidales bacterium]NLK81126.1 KilA-N domain-containing protein [Bacteroidales bacterium]HPY81913.1 KilA-N domain-containing protein [Bacteroidales bacterium]
MAKNKKIQVQGVEIILYEDNSNDFISLTDIARHKNPTHTDTIIQNWMRNRNTIELLGFWETMYNRLLSRQRCQSFLDKLIYYITMDTLEKKDPRNVNLLSLN